MDIITINGVNYQRISTLSKKFKYTADYIGQLCRANKVDAQLVGRSWYVNPISLEEHKKSRFHKTLSDEKSLKHNTNSTKSKIDVGPVVTKNTARMSRPAVSDLDKSKRWSQIRYSEDQHELWPVIKSLPKKKEIINNSTPTERQPEQTSEKIKPQPTATKTYSSLGVPRFDSTKLSPYVEEKQTPPKVNLKVVELDPVIKTKPIVIAHRPTVSPIKTEYKQNNEPKPDPDILRSQESILDQPKDDQPKKADPVKNNNLHNFLRNLSVFLILILVFMIGLLLSIESTISATKTYYIIDYNFYLGDLVSLFR